MMYDTHESSVDFDFQSIMMFDSEQDPNADPNDPNAWDMTSLDGRHLRSGGRLREITGRDRARIAQLYNNHTPECEKAKIGFGKEEG